MSAEHELVDAIHNALYRLLLRRGVDDLTALADAGELLDTLQRQFGGRDHYVPRPDKGSRNARIAADLAANLPASAVAEKHGVAPRTVRRIRKQIDQERADLLGFGDEDWAL